MKAMSGGLIGSSKAAYAYINSFDNVVPIWGVQRMSELDEFLSYMKEEPKLDKDLEEIIRKEREELQGDFCRGCGYCMPCPAGVDIPGCFRAWNTYHMYQNYNVVKWSWETAMGEAKQAKNCIKCGKCEKVCPQKIQIRENLERVQADLDKKEMIV